MELTLHQEDGQSFLEGAPGQRLLGRVEDVTALLEECYGNSVQLLLLYADNLTERFFDLSSGDAGEILQKLRNYRIRLAVVCPPGMPMSSRFAELLADERQGSDFGLFEGRAAARAWLVGG